TDSPCGPKSPEQSTGRVSVLSPRTNVLIYVLCVLTDTHRRPVCADGHPQTSCVCQNHPNNVLCVLNRQPTSAKITRTVHGKGQRADMCTDGQPRMSCVPRAPKSPKQSTGRVSVLSPRTNVLICVLMDSHGRPVCADGHTRTHTDSHGRPVCAGGHPQTKPTWAKITQTVHGKGQRAGSKDQRADMCTDGQPRTSYSPRGPKSPEQSTGRVSVLSPRTNVLICVLMDSHRRPVCADGHTRTHKDSHGRPPTWAKITQTVHGKGQRAESKDQRADMCTDGQPRTSCVHTRTATDVLCMLTDTHGRPVCADGHPLTFRPWMSCVCWRTPTDVLCVLNRQPTRAKITRTVHRKGQRAESMDQRADICTDGQPQTSCVHTRTATDVLCMLTDAHRRPVCADGHPRTSCVHTRTATDVLCVLADTHGHPVCTEQIAHVGQNHPNSPREGPACRVQGPTC
ncbi:unnamed protein product, partial [Brassica rapa]